jgi:hypothetical protein
MVFLLELAWKDTNEHRIRDPAVSLHKILLNMELTGRIIVVQEAKSGISSRTGKSWMKQEYVMEVPRDFPRHCTFTVFGEERIKAFNIQNGEDVTIQFDIDAHEYNGRWYNDFRAYNVIREEKDSGPVSTVTTPSDENLPPFPPMPDTADAFKNDDGSDLPF